MIIAVIVSVLHFVWAALMLWAAFFKLLEFEVIDFVRHYTNWAWVIKGLFLLATVPTMFVQVGWLRHDGAISKWVQFIIVIGYFPTAGISIVVRVLVWCLLGTNSPFLAKFLIDTPVSFVMLGDDAFHFLPVLTDIIFYLVYKKSIAYSHNRRIVEQRMFDTIALLVIFILYQVYIGMMISVFSYWLTNNPHIVYDTNIPDVLGVVVIILTLTVFIGGVVLYLYFLERVASRIGYTAQWLHRNEMDPKSIGSSKNDQKNLE